MDVKSVDHLPSYLTFADVHVDFIGPALDVGYLNALFDKVSHEYFSRLNFLFSLPFKIFIQPDNKLSNSNIDPPIPPLPFLQ